MVPPGRSRSSTVSSQASGRIEPERTLVSSQPLQSSIPITINPRQWQTASQTIAESYASQHTLQTIRPSKRGGNGGGGGARDSSPADSQRSRSTSSSSSSTPEEDAPARTSSTTNNGTITRGHPSFIIDLAPSSSPSHTRSRSATFGGVPLPPSQPIPSQPPSSTSIHIRPPILTRTRSTSSLSFSSIPSDLHVGGSFAQRRPMLWAGIQAGGLLLVSLVGMYVLLKTLLPPIDEEHKELVKLPKSFEDLKALNEVLQVYKDRHYYRVLGCYTTVYLFLQAFSIPGSMYLSILGGAMYGVLMALPLVCFCVATGALFCYFISQALGPAILLNSEKWQKRIDAWTERIASHRENLISYLIVLRIAPLPPHWVVNVVAPHLGISVFHFWISTFFGIAGVSYIHTTIGTTLDQMTSSNDFHLISWQNGLGLGGIIVAVLIPVLLRRLWKKDLEEAAIDAPTHSSSLLPSSSSSNPNGYIALSSSPAMGDGRELPPHPATQAFGLGESDEEDDEREEDGHEGGKGKDVQREWASAKGNGGDLNKASRLLGVEVVPGGGHEEEEGFGNGGEAGWGGR